MFRIWAPDTARPTKDIDFLHDDPIEPRNLEKMFALILAVPCLEDGVIFDVDSISSEPIKETSVYEGLRIFFTGHLGSIKLNQQVDIAHGDVIHPKPLMTEYPTLLDLPAPNIQCYTVESALAEKLHAMLMLGLLNSRMKDFYDTFYLLTHQKVDYPILNEAIAQTFKRRKTNWNSKSVIFSSEFAKDSQKQTQWRAFITKNNLTNAPTEFWVVMENIKAQLTKLKL